MKKYLYITLVSTLLYACGGGGGTTPTPTPVNTAPTVPTLTNPTNNQLCINNTVVFEWNASTDKEGDAITYQLQVATDNQFTAIAHSTTASTPTTTITLDKGTAYYWRVKATDSKQAASAYSSVFKFYTEGIGAVNHVPFAPELVSPAMNAAVTTSPVDLQWTATDVDTSDTLTYDVYAGTVNPPTTKVAAAITTTTFSYTPTVQATNYWYVIVKDNHGGQTQGQVWSFAKD